MVTATWAEWQRAHPATTIVAEDGGIGRRYSLDPLQGRDDDGPIFPIGDVDGRLPVQTEVFGVAVEGIGPVAFPVVAAREALAAGGEVVADGVALIADGDGLRARSLDGEPLVSHQAFWFAWSQFNPGTALWEPPA